MRLTPFALVLLVVIGCSSANNKAASGTVQPKESAGDALKRQYTALANGQYGREWDELHPALQAVVSRDRFTECASHASFPSLDGITVKEIYDDPVSSQYYPEKTSKAVTITLAVHRGSVRDTQTSTLHEVDVAGTWRWVLEDSAVAAYQKGSCPS